MAKHSWRGTVSRLRRTSGLERLERREKYVLAAGGLFVAAFLALQLVITPYLDARARLERSLQKNKQDLVEMALLQQQYQELKAEQGGIAKRLEQRDPQFSLFSFLEKQAAEVAVKTQVTYMKPSATDLEDGFRESAVEMKIEEVTLAQLVDFLVRVESDHDVVMIRRLAVQNNSRTSSLLDAVISIVTYERIAS